MLEGNKKDSAGYTKIINFCNVAQQGNLAWGWVDTCCIDKTSSAELTEAINAMYRWYKQPACCYAFLSDVVETDEAGSMCWPKFEHSKWFTRGWTLQELMAPTKLVFYDKYWDWIGNRSDVLERITTATAIPATAFEFPERYCVAQKMSWASRRETSRVEDLAYCLMGLFGVQMPLLYGEGPAAFQRLQLEIMKVSSDETLLVWGSPGPEPDLRLYGPLLAPVPASFAQCGDVRKHHFFWRKPYLMTPRGLKVSTSLYIDTQGQYREASNDIYLVPLNCRLRSETQYPPPGPKLALELRSLAYVNGLPAQAMRIGWREMPEETEETESANSIYISTFPSYDT